MKVKITKTWTQEYADGWVGFYWNRKDSKLYINGFLVPFFWFLTSLGLWSFTFILIGINFDWYKCKICGHRAEKHACANYPKSHYLEYD